MRPKDCIVFIGMFLLRRRINYFVGHQKLEISNVCVLPGIYYAYSVKMMVYGYPLMKRLQLELTNNVSSKKTIQLAFARVLQVN